MTDWPFGDLTPSQYGIILADPPWRMKTWSEDGLSKSPEQHYDTMTEAEITALPVGKLAAKDCMLFLWCRWINLKEALRVMDAWGFTYVSGGSWQKRTVTFKKTFGTGYITRNSTEPYLVGRRGNLKRQSNSVRDSITTVERHIEAFTTNIDSERREHSRKPQEMRDNLDLLFPHVRGCELFAREPWAGRDVWGNEVNKFGGRNDQ